MPNDGYKKACVGLLKSHVSLGDSAGTIGRNLRKTPHADTRRKLVAELRGLDRRRLDLLDQMDDLTKST
jgi:hypothetical protein